jgi:hypothetical protein
MTPPAKERVLSKEQPEPRLAATGLLMKAESGKMNSITIDSRRGRAPATRANNKKVDRTPKSVQLKSG